MKIQFLIMGIVLCVLSVFLMRFGYKSITDSEYEDAVENYDYYESQMEETGSMARNYGDSSVFRSTYSRLAAGWKNLLDDAGRTIVTIRIKAGIGFGGGILCIIFGIALIVAGCKKGKKEGASPGQEMT